MLFSSILFICSTLFALHLIHPIKAGIERHHLGFRPAALTTDQYSGYYYGDLADTNTKSACRYTGENGRLIACVKPGANFTFVTKFQNTGLQTWRNNSVFMKISSSNKNTQQALNSVFMNNIVVTNDVARGQNYTFQGTIVAADTLTAQYNLYFDIINGDDQTFISSFSMFVEVTCSDGIFCNGMERYVSKSNNGGLGGVCMSAVRPHCDDGESCTDDFCDESTQLCSRKMSNSTECANTPSCNVAGGSGNATVCISTCTADLNKPRVCGGDGCGDVCGDNGGLCLNNLACNNEGHCVVATQPGTCTNPYSLFQTESLVPTGQTLGRHIIPIDTSLGIQQVRLSCNPLATAPQVVYQFRVPSDGVSYGLDLRLSNVTVDLDTVIELRQGTCFDNSSYFIETGVGKNIFCSDDASPPGGVGSRVVTELVSGATYYIVAGGYNDQTVGPAELDFRFTKNYVPSCLSRFCGPDGGGNDCGPCTDGNICNEFLKCSSPPTSAACTVDRCKNVDGTDRHCGSDGCGGTCGTCNSTASEFCLLTTGTCTTFDVCNHFQPICKMNNTEGQMVQGCKTSEYCGHDCNCHAVDEKLADLTPDRSRFIQSVKISSTKFDNYTCAYAESCISGLGSRKLMRFDTTTFNHGTADLVLPVPENRPDEFTFALCHNHYHFQGYAEYRLISKRDQILTAKGHKQGYCMEDSGRLTWLQSPKISCTAVTTCPAPGISMGYYDVYGNDLDCQWIDVTDVPPGEYDLRIELNVERRMFESTIENNAVTISVTIPADPTTAPPTTVAPTTAAPTTSSPTTVSPSTVSPTTASPSTVSPSTASPSTVSPSTSSPSTVSPSTVATTTSAASSTATTPVRVTLKIKSDAALTTSTLDDIKSMIVKTFNIDPAQLTLTIGPASSSSDTFQTASISNTIYVDISPVSTSSQSTYSSKSAADLSNEIVTQSGSSSSQFQTNMKTLPGITILSASTNAVPSPANTIVINHIQTILTTIVLLFYIRI